MKRFPLLEAMRAERERHEAAIEEPWRLSVAHWQDRARRIEDSLRRIEFAIGTKIGQYALEHVNHLVVQEVRKMIFEKAGEFGQRKPVTFTLSGEALAYMMPDSLERTLIDRFASEAAPLLRLSADFDPEQRVTVLDVRIPELACRKIISESVGFGDKAQ